MDTRTVRFGDRERDTSAFDRAEDETASVVPVTRFLYRVAFRDGGTHLVLLGRDADDWIGGCDCKGWFYNGRNTGKPCSHLWALKRTVETVDTFAVHEIDDALEYGGTCPVCDQLRPEYANQIEVSPDEW